jgi:hypothetical protein
MVRAALLLLLLADISPKGPDPALPVEKLGNRFESKGGEKDGGMSVSVWTNLTLRRDERWHHSAQEEWFVRVRAGLYVLAVHEPKEGGWVTCPAERIVWRDRAWRRITVRK